MDWLTISNIALTVAVGFHIACEFAHYIYDFFNAKKNKSMLDNMHKHMERIEKRLNELEKK